MTPLATAAPAAALPFDSAVLYIAASAELPQRISAFRVALTQLATTQAERFNAGADAVLLVRDRARAIDVILQAAWTGFFHTDTNAALVAVGGYGRGELHPGSDVDLLLVVEGAHDDAVNTAIAQFLTFLWDIGLHIGQSVRTVAECAAEATRDITVATNLMEARVLTGPPALFAAMSAAVQPAHIWPSREFFEAKWQEQIARHRKFHDAVSNLEPNVKEGPGGLRDIQMIGWVARRHFGTGDFYDLVAHQFLTMGEYETLMQSQAFLWKVRFGLHIIAGRREDRLLFDHQKTLAHLFGYSDGNHRRAVEHFMKDYYVTITELARLNEMLLQLFQEVLLHAEDSAVPQPLNRRFQVRKGFLEATHPDVFKRYPFALLEVFLLLQQHPEVHGVRATTVRLMRDHRYLIDDKYRNDIRNRSLFMEILRQPRGITHELRRMHRYGILAAYIPSFGRIVGLMQFDLFHVYTVDEHSLMVLRNLRRFCVPEFAHEVVFCSKLAQQIPRLELLYLGGLFHDIAKGRGGDHSKLGADEALQFCLHHGLSNYDARLVAWLVRQHLIMSSTAQRQDISDPDVITAFAKQVGDQAHLDYLFLLTCADIRGTSPELWNGWKYALLLELYHATKRALWRGLEQPIDRHERLAEVQTAAREQLHRAGFKDATIDQLWQSFSEEHFLRHNAEEIAWQSEVILERGEQLPLVVVHEDKRRDASTIFVYTNDVDYLFAGITSMLSQMGLDILDARIITTDAGLVFDTFTVLDANHAPIRDRFQIADIESRLARVARNPSKEGALARRPLPRRLKAFAMSAEVTFSTDAANRFTVVELVAGDRPGLLALVGKALAECEVSLHSAKIGTFGERVEDVFYVTDKHKRPLQDEAQFACLRNRIRELLDAGDA
mgnify:CR=1 FL=1